MKEKTQVEDIDRSIYDIKDKENDAYRMEDGLTPEIIEKLSRRRATLSGCASFVSSPLKRITKCRFPTGAPR